MADRAARPDERRLPFDPRRRRMAVAVAGEWLVKGAPEAYAGAALTALTQRGLRVITIACGLLAGVAASLLPARQAARLDIVAALQYE